MGKIKIGNLLNKVREDFKCLIKKLKQPEATIEKSPKISAFAQIFGYSGVGIISLLYGYSKQRIDLETEGYVSIIQPNPEAWVLAVFNIIVTVYFGYTYARIYFLKTGDSDCKRRYDRYGIIIPIILVIFGVVAAILLIFPLGSKLKVAVGSLFLVALPSIGTYLLCILFYYVKFRRPIENGKEIDAEKANEARYLLVIPALAVIACNIFTGCSFFDIYNRLYMHFVYGDTLFADNNLAFIVIYYGLHFALIACLFSLLFTKRENVSKVYVFFSAILAMVGIAGRCINANYSKISVMLLNFFLAIMTSIFLSIFESWYTYFRLQDNETLVNSQKSIIKTDTFLIATLPSFIFLIYPLQTFNYGYILGVSVGMIIIDWAWFTHILPLHDAKMNGLPTAEDEHCKQGGDIFEKHVGRIRGILGVVTLVLLFFDQFPDLFKGAKTLLSNLFSVSIIKNGLAGIFIVNDDQFIGLIFDIMVSAVLFTCLTTALKKYQSLGEIFGDSLRIPIIVRITSYSVSCVLLLIYSAANFDDKMQMKYYVSTILLLFFIMADLIWGLYKYCQYKEKHPEESKGEE